MSTPLRKTPAPSNAAAPFTGPATLEAINDEVRGLWRYAIVPLSSVGGTANAITAVCDVPLDVAQKGNGFLLTPVAANTGAATLNVGKGPKALVNRDGSALAAGRLAAGVQEVVTDDGTSYRLAVDKPAASSAPPLTALFAYQLARNTASANIVAGWQTYPINMQVQNNIPGLSLNAATFTLTLPNRPLRVRMKAFTNNADPAAVFLWNVSGAAPITANFVRQPACLYGAIEAEGLITPATSMTAQVKVYAVSASGNFGEPLNLGSPSTPEQYGFIAFEAYP